MPVSLLFLYIIHIITRTAFAFAQKKTSLNAHSFIFLWHFQGCSVNYNKTHTGAESDMFFLTCVIEDEEVRRPILDFLFCGKEIRARCDFPAAGVVPQMKQR